MKTREINKVFKLLNQIWFSNTNMHYKLWGFGVLCEYW
jgi:hypothetical protein